MAAIVVFESSDADALVRALVADQGFLQKMEGYAPTNGHGAAGALTPTWHWPIESDLPTNVLYSPDEDAKDAYRRVVGWAHFNNYDLQKAVAFNVGPEWHGYLNRFNHDKPGKNFDEIRAERGELSSDSSGTDAGNES
jgi:hypothetical protein